MVLTRVRLFFENKNFCTQLRINDGGQITAFSINHFLSDTMENQIKLNIKDASGRKGPIKTLQNYWYS